jgi:hypothetical protein
MTAIFACICGKYDESQDFENDFKDKHGPLNEHVHFVVNMCFRFYFDYLNFYVLFYIQRIISPAISTFHTNLDVDDLYELRKNRLFEIKMGQIMKEISIYLLFLFVLFVVAFSNLSSSSFQFNQLFLNTFVNKQNGENVGLNEVNVIPSISVF